MSTWLVVTCTACGTTGPGRAKAGLCKRCYARALHPVRPCKGCGQARRHMAAGLCARCYRLSRTTVVVCPGCGELRPVHLAGRCQRCASGEPPPGPAAARTAAGRSRACGRAAARPAMPGPARSPCPPRKQTPGIGDELAFGSQEKDQQESANGRCSCFQGIAAPVIWAPCGLAGTLLSCLVRGLRSLT